MVSPWLGLAGLALTLATAVVVFDAFGVVPDGLSLRGTPHWMIALLAAPFAGIGLFLSLAAIGSLTRREGLNRLAAAVGIGGVGVFLAGVAVFLTYDSLAPGGGTLRRGLGEAADILPTAINRVFVAGLALFADALVVGVIWMFVRRRARRRRRVAPRRYK